MVGNVIKLSQTQNINNVERVNKENIDQSFSVSQHARGAYIACTSQPDHTFGFAVSSQVIIADTTSAQRLQNLYRTKTHKDLVICFVPPDMDSLQLAVLEDGRFAFSLDVIFYLGNVTCLTDKFEPSNIVHYTRFKAKRDTPVLLDELFALFYVFDYASTIR